MKLGMAKGPASMSRDEAGGARDISLEDGKPLHSFAQAPPTR